MKFEHRWYKKELLDEDNIPVNDLYRNLYELNFINKHLGGHEVTLNAVKQLQLDSKRVYRVLDIGCGGGDTLKAIAEWALDNGFKFELTGVDLKEDCINYAKAHCKEFKEIGFIQADYRNLHVYELSFDIIIASLFCHHLRDEELKSFFTWCAREARVAFIMNDLHRHALAYYSIAMLTSVFSRSYLVKNDAKLSVLRGFSRKELHDILSASVPLHMQFTLQWKWAFRWQVIITKNRK